MITCPSCGSSTPLPHDLTIATFTCGSCQAELRTADFAGKAAVSADALLGHIEAVAAKPPADIVASVRQAPRFEGGSAELREAPCRRCQAVVQVPLDLQVNQLTCAGCGARQAVRDYVSDEERFALDMARQVAGNEALKRLVAEGVACRGCGAHNGVPDDDSVQLTCAMCGATLLLADYVDASALARRRLKHGVYAVRDQLMATQESSQRRARWIAFGVVAVVLVVLGAGFAVVSLAGAVLALLR